MEYRREYRKRKAFMAWIQLMLSIVLMVILGMLDILPINYLVVIALVFLILFVFSWKLCRSRHGWFLGRVMAFLLILVMGIGTWYLMKTYAVLDSITDSQTDGAEKSITKEFFTVYISGNDENGELQEKGRSDVNIIAAVNPKTRQVLLVSTPRDYYVPLAMNGQYDKLTHAGMYGVEESMKTLENLYGISLDYHIKMNFTGFVEIIDAIGGITVDSDTAFTSVDGIAFQQGENEMDGAKALAFARERKAHADGDVQRGRNQMKIIKAVIRKMMSPALLLRYSAIMDATQGCLATSMNSESVTALLKMQIQDGGNWNIETFNVDGYAETCWTYSYAEQPLSVLIPDMESVQQAQILIQQVQNGEIPDQQ